jgi:hypothetical protein
MLKKSASFVLDTGETYLKRPLFVKREAYLAS